MPSIAAQRLEAVADQRRAAHRGGDLAVLDQVALRDAEDEVAGGRLDLPTAERNRVEAALDAGDQVLGAGVAGREEGVGHARHRQVPERLAPAVASRRDAVLARRAAGRRGSVVSRPVLDHRGALGRGALVVDAVAAPFARAGCRRRRRSRTAPRAVRRACRRRRWRASARRPPQARGRPPRAAARRRSRCRRPPDSRPLGASHRVEQRQRPACRRSATCSGSSLEQLEAGVAAARVGARLDPPVAARHHLGAEPHARAVVGRRATVGVDRSRTRRRPSA